MENVGISIIIPVYNVEDYLGECIDSLLSQSYKDIEILLVDDGSTDGSAAICREYADKDPRVRYYLKENGGAGSARNYGIEKASGKYLFFVDSDDIIPEDAIEKLYITAEENDADIVVGNVMRLHEGEAGTARMFSIIFSDYEKHTSLKKNHTLLHDVIVCCKLYRKSYWDKYGFRYPLGLSYCEDIPLAFDLYSRTDNVVMLDEVVYLWRVREGENLSSTQKKSLRMVEDRINAMRMINSIQAETHQDAGLVKAEKFKQLYMDLNILINKAVDLDDESLQMAMKMIKDYIAEAKLETEFSRLPILYEKKYKAVRKGDYKKLRQIRDFQTDVKSCIGAERKEDKVTGIFPSSIVLFKKADLKTTLDCELLRQNILRVDVEEDSISILGCAFLRYLPVSKASDADIRIWLVDGDRNKVKELSVKRRNTKTPGKMESKKNSNNIDYTGTGYTAVLTAGEADALAPGAYRFLVEWEACGQHREALIQRIKPEDEEKIKGLPFPGASRAVLDTTINREPVVIIHEDNQENKELS